MKWLRRGLGLVAVLVAVPLLMASCGAVPLSSDWRTASRSSAGIAPAPGASADAVVQVYAARAFGWRGIFAVHTWIATKPAGAPAYTVHQVVGWRQRRGLPVVVSALDVPDRAWYGSRPELLADLRGDRAARAIPEIEAAIARYPYAERYRMWPGPNSNTFVAHVARSVPALSLDLPPTAIGKDFLTNGSVLDRAPSGAGVQVSLLGILGLIVAPEEGVELNLLSLGLGVDALDLALRLPGLGRLAAR